MITKLRLKGWRSHLDSEFEFSDGTNALIGVMGSGKSSVLDAISFAFFGTFPSLQARRLTLEDVIMKRPQRVQAAEVVLELQWNGATYTIKRVVKRGGARQAEIRQDGRLLDAGVTKVTEFVERILHTNYDLFSKAVYAEQNGLGYFLTIQKGQRMKRIDELLHIDRFEAARSTCNTVLNRLRANVQDKSALVKEIESSEELGRIASLEVEVAELEKRNKQMRAQDNELNEAIVTLEEELQGVRKRDVERRTLEMEKSVLHGAIKTLEEDVAAHEESVQELQKVFEEINQSVNETQELLTGLDVKRSDAQRVKQRLELALEEARQRIEQLQSAGATCPFCEQPISEKHRQKHLAERKKQMEELLRAVLEAEGAVRSIEEKIRAQQGVLETLKKQVGELEKKLFYAREAEKKRQRISDLMAKLVQTELRLATLKETMVGISIDDIQKKLREASSALAAHRAELRALEKILVDKTNELHRLNERKELFEKYKTQIQRMEKLAEDLKKFYAALEQTQLALRREFIEAVNVTMSNLWETLYPYEDYIDVRLGVRDDYVLEMKENGGDWVPVEGVASGGERTTALLALRMAFAFVLAPNLRWLVLDEPTHNLDVNAVEQLAEVLRDRIGEYVDQVFLITHDEKLENAVTGFLYRLEREREKNEPTRVIKILDPGRLETQIQSE